MQRPGLIIPNGGSTSASKRLRRKQRERNETIESEIRLIESGESKEYQRRCEGLELKKKRKLQVADRTRDYETKLAGSVFEFESEEAAKVWQASKEQLIQDMVKEWE
jgi:hypothetical protein